MLRLACGMRHSVQSNARASVPGFGGACPTAAAGGTEQASTPRRLGQRRDCSSQLRRTHRAHPPATNEASQGRRKASRATASKITGRSLTRLNKTDFPVPRLARVFPDHLSYFYVHFYVTRLVTLQDTDTCTRTRTRQVTSADLRDSSRCPGLPVAGFFPGCGESCNDKPPSGWPPR